MPETATHYEATNLMGNWNAGTWNVLPAVLTAWSNLLQLGPNRDSYSLYKQQAREYVRTAKENAQLIENQRDIALRNLRYKNKLMQGDDIVRAAASNLNMSGSTLDLLVRKEKIRKMNEQTLNANYTNQAMLEMANGYRQAASAYGSLAAKAGADKWAAWASILKGVETYVSLQVRDAKVKSAVDAGHQRVRDYQEEMAWDQYRRYGEKPAKGSVPKSEDVVLNNKGLIFDEIINAAEGAPLITEEGVVLNSIHNAVNTDIPISII